METVSYYWSTIPLECISWNRICHLNGVHISVFSKYYEIVYQKCYTNLYTALPWGYFLIPHPTLTFIFGMLRLKKKTKFSIVILKNV